ncbi:MAG: hypothetical protein HY751_12005 [Nitrospinae bacterium]|nr:hypothetical protein [Nitrospinota bacterium]
MSDGFKFEVNEKIQFRLTPDPGDEGYVCLVKKTKDNLVAIVISNNDKSRVTLDAGDDIYLFSESDGEQWITPARLNQKQSFPLVILGITGEPFSISGEARRKMPPAPLDEIEKIDEDLTVLTAPEETESLEVEPPAPARGEYSLDTQAEEPLDVDLEEDLSAIPGITSQELSKEEEPDNRQASIPMVAGVELEDLPEIDTSELEAELDADIESTLAGGPGDALNDEDSGGPPLMGARDDDLESLDEELSGLEVNKDVSLDLGDIDDTTIIVPPPARERKRRVEPEPRPEPEEEETAVLFVPEVRYTGAEQEFHDFFGLFVTPLGEQEAGKISAAVGAGEEVSPGLSDSVISGGLDPVTRQAFTVFTGRLERLEKALVQITGEDNTTPTASAAPRIGAVCARLGDSYIQAAMDDAPLTGGRFLIEVDRPWKPSLSFRAVAVAESSFSVNDVTLARFVFERLSPGAGDQIAEYLEKRKAYFNALASLVRD